MRHPDPSSRRIGVLSPVPSNVKEGLQARVVGSEGPGAPASCWPPG
ncbi:MAG: hypothetical protein KatS3mg059_0108 [Thermomicrobiales bacterium]|nr:MAG: hypothetical protein KatS3mg059_0108 [Thermomicrobiales bacterium]